MMIKFRNLFLLLAVGIFVSCAEKQEQKQVSSFDDLKGSEVAVILGSMYDLYVSDFSGLEIKRVPNPADLLTTLEYGKSAYALIDSVMLIDPVIRAKNFKVDFSGFNPNYYALAFRKTDTTLCRKFNEFLAQIKSNGVYADMYDRWTSDKSVEMPTIQLPKDENPILVGTLGANPPFSFFKDNEWVGFEIEMLQRFAQSAGRSVQFFNYDFGALIASLNANKIDVIVSTMSVTEERAEQVLFSDSYFGTVGCCISFPQRAEQAKSAGFIDEFKDAFHRNIIAEKRYLMLWDGFLKTLTISFFAILLGTILGIAVCLLRMSKSKIVVNFAKCYVELMRGIPILVFLMVMFYVIFASTSMSAVWVAVFAFAMNFAAYVSEMFRTAIQSVDKGQTEAGIALGFSRFKTFIYIVAPQAIRQVLPVYRGEAISLIKNTSIVGYIAIQDLTKVSDIIRSRTFDAFFPLLIISVIYFLLAWLLGFLLDYLNKKI